MKNKNQLEFYKLFQPLAEDNRLTHVEKIVAMYIFTLHSFNKNCFASNKYMASILNVSSSAVDTAIIKLQNLGYIQDLRNEPNEIKLKILNTKIANSNFYKFYKVVLESDLKYSSKFLLTYILSYTNNNKRCYDTNANILKRIGIGKDGIATAKKELKTQGWLYIKNPRSPRREFVLKANRNPIAELKTIQANKSKATLRPEISNTKPNNRITSPKTSMDSPEDSHNKIINNRIKKENSNNKIYNNTSETLLTATQLETFLDLDYSDNFYDIPIESLDILESSTSVNVNQDKFSLDSNLNIDDSLTANTSPTVGNSPEKSLNTPTDNTPMSESVDNTTDAVATAETTITNTAEAQNPISISEAFAAVVAANKMGAQENESIIHVINKLDLTDEVSVIDFLIQLYLELDKPLDTTNILNIEHHINQSHCKVFKIIKALKHIYKENNAYTQPTYKHIHVPKCLINYLRSIFIK
ncbi:MAG: helix-turn-helix domain-containing protein [Winogradskyella arenosi]